MMNLDFTTAKLKHSAWKSKLRAFLDGKEVLTPQQATSHKDCDLGKWLYAEGLEKYKHVPEMAVLEREHQTLHTTVRSIVALKHAGNTGVAEAEYAKVDAISKKIIDLLTVIESKVLKKAA